MSWPFALTLESTEGIEPFVNPTVIASVFA
jgi:hypothetical protein